MSPFRGASDLIADFVRMIAVAVAVACDAQIE
jgi:hypothetical protein